MSVVRRLIIVARDEPDLFDYIRRDNFDDDGVEVIADRRRGERRVQARLAGPERRTGDRRRHDLDPLLRAHGWAEITP